MGCSELDGNCHAGALPSSAEQSNNNDCSSMAEDGGNMELCVLLPDGRVKVSLRLLGQDGSELTGPAFSPDGRHMNSQRGGRQGKSGLGITFEVTLPA